MYNVQDMLQTWFKEIDYMLLSLGFKFYFDEVKNPGLTTSSCWLNTCNHFIWHFLKFVPNVDNPGCPVFLPKKEVFCLLTE